MISKKALQEFKTIWEKEFGSPISDKSAIEQSTSLLTLLDAIYKPIKKEWVKKTDKIEDLS